MARKPADNPALPGGCPQLSGAGWNPAHLEDLAQHDCLLWTRDNRGGRTNGRWAWTATLFLVRAGSHPHQRWHGLAATACAGAGITLIDRLLVEQELADGTLVELLTPYSLSARPPLHGSAPGPAMAGAQHPPLCGVLLSRVCAAGLTGQKPAGAGVRNQDQAG